MNMNIHLCILTHTHATCICVIRRNSMLLRFEALDLLSSAQENISLEGTVLLKLRPLLDRLLGTGRISGSCGWIPKQPSMNHMNVSLLSQFHPELEDHTSSFAAPFSGG